MPEITVIITAYKLEKHLDACMNELMAQTFTDFNIVLVDDHSPDQTPKLIAQYEKRMPERVKAVLLPQNTGNPGSTRNAALDSGFVDGTYVVFLDGDDHIEPNFLQSLYTACQSSGADAAVCAYDRVEMETGHVLCHELTWLRGEIPLPPQDDAVAFLNGALWNKLFRRDAIGDLRSPILKGGQDLAFGLRILQRCNRLACVPNELIHYQVRGASVSKGTPEDSMHELANELYTQYKAAEGGWRDTIALLSFLHIGLSMALRAADNPEISTREYVRWARAYMKDKFGFYKGVKLMKLRSLLKRGVKGIVLFASLWMYKLNCFGLALAFNRLITRLFHVDIKF